MSKPEYNEACIQVLEARNLDAADFSLRGGSSDPYCVVKDVKGLIGDDSRTHTIKKNLESCLELHIPVQNELQALRFQVQSLRL